MTTLEKVEGLFDASDVSGTTQSRESEGTMDRLIWGAWRVFWIGLGASAVLIAQSLITAPSHDTAARLSPAQVTTVSATANVASSHVHLRPQS